MNGHKRVLFWDFDGVIKETVAVKTEAYVRLFSTFGGTLAQRVRVHHESNGGMSRLDKIPLYLDWAGQLPSKARVEQYVDTFAKLVYQAVLDAPWVPGAREYLESYHRTERFVLVSGTPEEEMNHILRDLGIAAWFEEVHGAPVSKSEAVRSVLHRWHCPREDALLIGDSATDYAAAVECGIEFILRRAPYNTELQRRHAGRQCDDFVTALELQP